MSADIDIDFADREQVLSLVQCTRARQTVDGKIRYHNSGVYVTDIPQDPLNACAAIDYQEAEQRGYFKIDLLNMTVYQLIKDQAHYNEMLSAPVPWDRLQDPEFCKKIVHIGNHYDIVKQLQPNNIPRMAMLLAVIRPAKRHLAAGGWAKIAQDIWTKPDDDSYFFKKSHAVGYAQLVALHINLIHFSHKSD
jgi:hypothetical protein